MTKQLLEFDINLYKNMILKEKITLKKQLKTFLNTITVTDDNTLSQLDLLTDINNSVHKITALKGEQHLLYQYLVNWERNTKQS